MSRANQRLAHGGRIDRSQRVAFRFNGKTYEGFAGRAQPVASGVTAGFQLFRIGDAVSARNIHAAVYDALRLVKDL